MRRMWIMVALLAGMLLSVCAPVGAAGDGVQPVDGAAIVGSVAALDHPLMDSGLVFEPYDPHLGFPQAFPGSLPSTGMVRFPVIVVEFTDYPADDSIADLKQVLNGPGDAAQFPCESLHGYFSRSSYGKLDLYGDLLGVYKVPYARSTVAYEPGDMMVVAAEKIVDDALDYFDGLGADFSQYDQNEDGLMDYAVVFWTGPEESRESLWWGFATDYGSEAYDGLELGVWAWMTEPPLDTIELPARTLIHETAHALGLPDYYDYDDSVGPSGGVGVWDMMSRGAGDLNAFSKILLGWINPEVVAAGSQRIVLRPASRYADALIVMPEFSLERPQREFFLIQAWDGSENDSFYLRFAKSRFPDVRPGLLIWHVDATPLDPTGFFHNNSYTEHKLLRLMEADGLEEIEASTEGTAGDSGDVYRTGASFGPATKPSSEPYWGSSSGVSLTNVTHAGDGITFTVSIGANDLDLVPPVTTDNHAGLDLVAPATISLTATDAGSGMSGGPAHTDYRVDGGEYQVGTTVTLTAGVHTLAYRSMDNAGNLESPEKSVTVVVLSSKPVFIDIANSPYLVAIQSMAALKVLSGYSDHTFRPDDPVTRQQFAKMVVKTLGLEVTGAEVSPFTDVVKQVGSDPFYPSKYVAVCAAAGITQGTSATTFAPNASITRQQLITMVVRAAGLEEPPAGYLPGFGGPQFSLAEHYQNARKAAYAGLLDGLVGVGAEYELLGRRDERRVRAIAVGPRPVTQVKQGIEHAWTLLAACDPQDVCDRADVEYSPESGCFVLRVLGLPVVVDVAARTIAGSDEDTEFILTKLAYFSQLSVLHYLLSAQKIEPTGRLVKPAELKSGQIYLHGSHLLPLEQIATRFSCDPDGFAARASRFGGQPRAYGDRAAELRPFPRVPVTIILWLGDDEFPARSYLLFDETCELQLPPDILWSAAMLAALVMLRR